MRARVGVRSARRRQRGAVLVEALIVIAAMVLFLVGLLFVHTAFSRQLQVQKASRAAAFAFAMNACESGTPSGLSAEDEKSINAPATAAGSTQTVADAQTGKIGEPAAASAFTQAASKNTGFGMPAVVAVSARGEASATDGRESFRSTLHSRTTLLCNEKPRQGELENAVQYIVDFMKGF